jgi:hypothetical protein
MVRNVVLKNRQGDGTDGFSRAMVLNVRREGSTFG